MRWTLYIVYIMIHDRCFVFFASSSTKKTNLLESISKNPHGIDQSYFNLVVTEYELIERIIRICMQFICVFVERSRK